MCAFYAFALSHIRTRMYITIQISQKWESFVISALQDRECNKLISRHMYIRVLEDDKSITFYRMQKDKAYDTFQWLTYSPICAIVVTNIRNNWVLLVSLPLPLPLTPLLSSPSPDTAFEANYESINTVFATENRSYVKLDIQPIWLDWEWINSIKRNREARSW